MTTSKHEPANDIFDFVIKKANGLKGLVDTGLESVRNQCIQQKEQRLDQSHIDSQESIPTIDVSNFDDLNVIKSIQEAASKWGFFQIINHGIPIEVLEDVKEAGHKFFELPAEEKVKYYKENAGADESVVLFWRAIGEKNEKVLEWRNSIKHGCNPQNDSNLWPPQTRDQVLKYMKWAKPIIVMLLEVLLERLNVKQIDEPMKSVVMGTLIVNLIHYPVCPSPELTAGAGRHADISSITLLLQDDVGGLYVREPKGDGWIQVPPVKGALVIHIGDVLQIMSNNRYKSVKHRVIVNASRNSVSPIFVNPAPDAVFGPLTQVLENGETPLYKQVVYSDYFNYFFSKGHEGKQTIEFAKTMTILLILHSVHLCICKVELDLHRVRLT